MDGNQLRALREQLGWTQVQMAEQLGVTANTIARWERDEMAIFEPAAKLVEILADRSTGHTNREATMTPFEAFLSRNLKEFESHLKQAGLTGSIEQRMKGAREFAVFLLGRPHQKGERTKGTI